MLAGLHKRASRYGHWWWPVMDEMAFEAVVQDARYVGPVCEMVRRLRDVSFLRVIQAGGNAGVYPCLMAREDVGASSQCRVISFEPLWLNYIAMALNVHENSSGVTPIFGALSSAPAAVRMEAGARVKSDYANLGARYAVPSCDDTMAVAFSIDQFVWFKPDLIWLDIEGGELSALRGAKETLTSLMPPVVIVEMKSLGERVGVTDRMLEEFMLSCGYARAFAFGNDVVWVTSGELSEARKLCETLLIA